MKNFHLKKFLFKKKFNNKKDYKSLPGLPC